MAAIPTILRGDDTGAIAIRLDDEHDYTGATLAFAYQGVTRTFAGLVAGGSVTVHFTRDETARMRLGAYSVLMELIGPTGGRETVANAEMKIKVTDCLAEVNSGSSFVIRPGTTGGVPVTDVGDMSDQYTLAELKDKVNQIVRVLAQRSILGAAIALLCAADAFAEVQTARLDELPNDALVVTNVTESAAGEYLPLSGGTLTGDLNLSEGEAKITVGSEAHLGQTTIGPDGIGQSCPRGPGVDRGFRIENDEGTVKIKKIGFTSDENVEFTLPDVGGCLVTDTQTEPIRDAADNALAYASGVYQFMNASTNAWFEGTNYNVNAEQAAGKVKYAQEPWEDVLYTPCSLQLYEIRDGERKCVWDQRDWTVYYWNFKSAQLSNDLSAATASLSASVETNYMRRGWSRYTAVNGLENPNPATLFVDTEKISLMAGMQWEKMIELSGHAYYTITGNGITLSTNEASSTFLTIKDFEGNSCLTFRKTSSYMVYCECGSEITGNLTDDQGRVCFRLNTEACPTAEFSTILDDTSFIEQGESGCPADYEWTGSSGAWICHFLLKPGIVSRTCFARFKILREGENVVEHTVPIKLSGGIVFEQDGHTYKIRPTVSGSTVSWTIVR